MFELFILITLVALVVLAISGGNTKVLDDPVIVQHPDQYHITLAPQLVGEQTFIENIARQFAESCHQANDIATQYFEISNSGTDTPGNGCYLLAVAVRGGILYFQAINPQPLLSDSDSNLKTIREFSEAVLLHHPLSKPSDELATATLRTSIETLATRLKITVKALHVGD